MATQTEFDGAEIQVSAIYPAADGTGVFKNIAWQRNQKRLTTYMATLVKPVAEAVDSPTRESAGRPVSNFTTETAEAIASGQLEVPAWEGGP